MAGYSTQSYIHGSLSWCRAGKREFQGLGPPFISLPWLTPHHCPIPPPGTPKPLRYPSHYCPYSISWSPQTSVETHLIITS